MNKRILFSSLSIIASAAIVTGATFAFFTDTETSADNTFTAGGLDLKVDYQCYYNKPADGTPNCPWEGVDGKKASWTETDLGAEHKFFNFTDIKPGDYGEGTISLHVVDNDAWGQLVINGIESKDNTCTESEKGPEPSCEPTGDGELREQLQFSMWLDEGLHPGFQCSTAGSQTPGVAKCTADLEEGDNVYQPNTEPILVSPGPLNATSENLNIAQGLSAAYLANGCAPTAPCPGLEADGRIVGSITYYFGVKWELPTSANDSVQTDSLTADMTFEVQQHRNQTVNPYPVSAT